MIGLVFFIKYSNLFKNVTVVSLCLIIASIKITVEAQPTTQSVTRSYHSQLAHQNSIKTKQNMKTESRILSADDLLERFVNLEHASKEQTQDAINESNESFTLLDARDLYPKFYWSHIQGAQHTPWRFFTQGSRSGVLVDLPLLTDKVQSLGIYPDQPVIIYGDWHKGWGEEARMLWLLEYLGHQKVYVIEGGWEAIKSLNIPKSWGKTERGKRSSWIPKPQEYLRATHQKVKELLSKSVVSIDARSLKEYEGATPYGSAYGGHFANSIHLEMHAVLDAKYQLKSKSELKALFTSLGLQKKQTIFTYCTGGIRSAFIYLALREAGFEHTMNYDGSWWEWTEKHPNQVIAH